ncbi:MAG: hypothetical protein IPL40_02240 [Proteobacteria bacterium]|nr:hypothetical protein [Pseudomonadota bacterium]
MAMRGMGWVEALFDDARGAFQRLAARDRLLVLALAATFCLLVVGGGAYLLFAEISELGEESRAMRKALIELEHYREPYRQAQQQQLALAQRVPPVALELNEFLEGAASAAGVKIDESNETASAAVGPYLRSGLEVKVRKVKVGELGKLLGRIAATTQHLVQVRELSVSTRWGRPDELDVELVIATYSRQPLKAAGREPREGG